MGYMTVVSILNDAWHDIKENPEQFIANIEKGMHDYDASKVIHHYPISGYCNPMEVRRSFHANQSNLLLVGGNHMEDIVAIDATRMDDFYLAYKVRAMHEAEDKVAQAKMNLCVAIANAIEVAMKNQGKGKDQILEAAETIESFMALSDNERGIVFKMVEKSFTSKNAEAFK